MSLAVLSYGIPSQIRSLEAYRLAWCQGGSNIACSHVLDLDI